MNSSGNYSIRKAHLNDAQDVTRLLFGLKTQYASCSEKTIKEFSANFIDSITKALQSDSNIIYVATHNDKIVAFLSGTTRLAIRTNGIVGVMEEVYVEEPHRKKGIGKEMWKHFTKHLSDNGVKYVEVVTSMAHPGQREFSHSIGLEWYSSIHRVVI